MSEQREKTINCQCNNLSQYFTTAI